MMIAAPGIAGLALILLKFLRNDIAEALLRLAGHRGSIDALSVQEALKRNGRLLQDLSIAALIDAQHR